MRSINCLSVVIASLKASLITLKIRFFLNLSGNNAPVSHHSKTIVVEIGKSSIVVAKIYPPKGTVMSMLLP